MSPLKGPSECSWGLVLGGPGGMGHEKCTEGTGQPAQHSKTPTCSLPETRCSLAQIPLAFMDPQPALTPQEKPSYLSIGQKAIMKNPKPSDHQRESICILGLNGSTLSLFTSFTLRYLRSEPNVISRCNTQRSIRAHEERS